MDHFRYITQDNVNVLCFGEAVCNFKTAIKAVFFLFSNLRAVVMDSQTQPHSVSSVLI